MRIVRIVVALAVSLLGILSEVIVYSHPAEAQSTSSHRVCSVKAKAGAMCLAELVTDSQGVPLVAPSAAQSGYGPLQFHSAYNLPCSVNGKKAQAVCSSPSHFGGQTVAIVDANSDPNIEADLAVYDAAYNLPPCTTSNGCLTIVNENGASSPLPPADVSWGLEISLDVETVHEICQTCSILLVEAQTNILTAEATAVSLGATEISNSYTFGERSDATSLDFYYNHPGVAVVAATGDSGYGPQYPADSPFVVAAGGTTLTLSNNKNYAGESAWSGAGSGCSLYEPANPWQIKAAGWSRTGCGTSRGIADVAADADPATGAAVFDSYGYGGWLQVGGTSLASPLIAAVFALAGGTSSSTNAQSVPYSLFTSRNSHDVTAGSNGSCTTSSCMAMSGYDGPTGLGTPNGTGGF
jgi:subtilase family serine protease